MLTRNRTQRAWATRSQSFQYDALNRITVGETTSTYSTSPSHCWGESFLYDNSTGQGGPWGNLTSIGAAGSPYNGCTQESLSQSVLANNQISGFCYDAAGNLLGESVCPASTYAYNAENQLTSTAGVNYTYDGDGNRVEQSNGTLYWYGLDGNVLDETGLSGSVTNEYVYLGGRRVARLDPSGNAFYYLSDSLGTSRVIAEVPSGGTTATMCYDADFYPFGGERAYTDSCDAHYKFTGKERDPESNLDNFGARYDSSAMGRFMSPDPLGILAGRPSDPESLNFYSYVENNPVNAVDPDGQDCLFVQDNTLWDASGNCTGIKNGKYVAGTVDTTSVTYDPSTGTINYSYTPYSGGLGSGTLSGVYPSSGVAGSDLLNAAAQGTQMAGYFLSAPQRWYNSAVDWLERHPAVVAGLAAATAFAPNGNPEGETTEFEDVTRPGSRYPNKSVDLTPDQFGANLEASGYKKSTVGDVRIYVKGDREYDVYPQASSTGGPSAQYRVAGKTVGKLRLR